MARIVSANEVGVIETALAELADGRAVAIPTETVYGLAANAEDGRAVARIFALKERPQFNPLIAHVASMEMAERIGVFNRHAQALAAHFWPGPLTLVVPHAPQTTVHELVSAGLETIGIRWPQGMAAKIIQKFGKPLAAPSANKSGRISPTLAHHVADDFSDDDLLIIDNGPAEKGIESTIARVTETEVTILRPGSITLAILAGVVDIPVRHYGGGTEILAPGMMASHYAPQAAVVLEAGNYREGDGLLAFGPIFGADHAQNRSLASHVLNLSPEGNLEEAASNLYAFLKALDAKKPTRICVEPIPDTGIGLAINDRLKRAAAPRQ